MLCGGGAAALAGTAIVTGCSAESGSSSVPSGTSSDASPGGASSDRDAEILAAARAELRMLVTRLSATTGAGPRVARHRVQLAALGGEPPSPTRRSRPLSPAATAAHERRAADRFTRWALSCQNGDLARVLASVAAGIRMQPVLQGAR